MFETGNHCCTNLFWRRTPLEADWLAERLSRTEPPGRRVG